MERVGSGGYPSSQIVGWRKTSFPEWKLACAHMSPPFFDHTAEAVYELPMLSGRNFPGWAQKPIYSWGWIPNPETALEMHSGGAFSVLHDRLAIARKVLVVLKRAIPPKGKGSTPARADEMMCRRNNSACGAN